MEREMETKLVCAYFSCDWIFLSGFEPFSYRLPVNMNNYTEKGQTKSLGNGKKATSGRTDT